VAVVELGAVAARAEPAAQAGFTVAAPDKTTREMAGQVERAATAAVADTAVAEPVDLLLELCAGEVQFRKSQSWRIRWVLGARAARRLETQGPQD